MNRIRSASKNWGLQIVIRAIHRRGVSDDVRVAEARRGGAARRGRLLGRHAAPPAQPGRRAAPRAAPQHHITHGRTAREYTRAHLTRRASRASKPNRVVLATNSKRRRRLRDRLAFGRLFLTFIHLP